MGEDVADEVGLAGVAAVVELVVQLIPLDGGGVAEVVHLGQAGAAVGWRALGENGVGPGDEVGEFGHADAAEHVGEFVGAVGPGVEEVLFEAAVVDVHFEAVHRVIHAAGSREELGARLLGVDRLELLFNAVADLENDLQRLPSFRARGPELGGERGGEAGVQTSGTGRGGGITRGPVGEAADDPAADFAERADARGLVVGGHGGRIMEQG